VLVNIIFFFAGKHHFQGTYMARFNAVMTADSCIPLFSGYKIWEKGFYKAI